MGSGGAGVGNHDCLVIDCNGFRGCRSQGERALGKQDGS